MRMLIALILAACTTGVAAEHAGVGREATPAEVRAWDIDVRPDFEGLPAGSGSVSRGESLWIAKCSNCHGDFGDSNHVFAPLVGNTTPEDIRNGRVASLEAGGSVRTTFAKVATVSTLWDYIHRAMPWDAPKTLSHDEVYALLAYLLNLAEIVPADYVLSDRNMAEVQARMPNRNGMTRDHGLWDVRGKPDTANAACMKNCMKEVVVTSELPGYALNAHGNLADQNRSFGAVRGQVTDPAAITVGAASVSPAVPAAITALVANGCLACHAMDKKVIGPGFAEIATRHRARADAVAYLAEKVSKGSSGVWGQIAMPPQLHVSSDDLATIAVWIAGGAQP